MDETLKSRYDYKSGGVLGPDHDDDSEVTYLNRVIRYVKGSNPRVEIVHDMRHLDYLMRDLGLDGIRLQSEDARLPISQGRHARGSEKNKGEDFRPSRLCKIQIGSNEGSLPLT
eukprot:3059445-Amphidinium_carterae.2